MRQNQLLLVLDDILSSDEAFQFELHSLEKMTKMERRMENMLSLLYRLVHSHTPHTCSHPDWKNEAMDLWMKRQK